MPTPAPDVGASPSELVRAERAFRAMGADAHVFVWQRRDDPRSPADLLDGAVREIQRRERLWSRFLPNSDISRLNRATGTPVTIAPDTARLLAFCADAQRATAGRFDPSVLPELLAAGYDRSFELLDHAAEEAAGDDRVRGAPAVRRDPGGRARRVSTFDLLRLDAESSTATVHRGSAIDLGGVGKGWTADLVTQWLRSQGAVAACVNIGGDLCASGDVAEPEGLVVGVEDPFGGPDVALLRIEDAGVATSARTRRRWPTRSGPMHHLIDPATGLPAETGIAAVTVVAPTGAWAEVAAKAVFLGGDEDPAPLLAALGASALIVDDGGALRTVGELPELVA